MNRCELPSLIRAQETLPTCRLSRNIYHGSNRPPRHRGSSFLAGYRDPLVSRIQPVLAAPTFALADHLLNEFPPLLVHHRQESRPTNTTFVRRNYCIAFAAEASANDSRKSAVCSPF
jgi:hypothetical protein